MAGLGCLFRHPVPPRAPGYPFYAFFRSFWVFLWFLYYLLHTTLTMTGLLRIIMFDDIPVLHPKWDAVRWIGKDPQMILVTGIIEARLGRVEFQPFAFVANQLVLDPLEVTPITKDGLAI